MSRRKFSALVSIQDGRPSSKSVRSISSTINETFTSNCRNILRCNRNGIRWRVLKNVLQFFIWLRLCSPYHISSICQKKKKETNWVGLRACEILARALISCPHPYNVNINFKWHPKPVSKRLPFEVCSTLDLVQMMEMPKKQTEVFGLKHPSAQSEQLQGAWRLERRQVGLREIETQNQKR